MEKDGTLFNGGKTKTSLGFLTSVKYRVFK